MPKYLSGRQKLRPSDKLTEDRYQYLGLDQAEPNLADPLTSPGVPGGTQYQLVAVAGYDGRRYWVPVGGAVIPGAITVFDEGSPVSSASSITQLNFVGAAVTANVNVQSPSGHPGIAATVTVIPVNVGDNPPNTPTPNEGELWWESDTGDLYIYYNDGDSSQWVMTNSGGRGLTGDKGEIGPKGEKGQKGELGNTGSQGDKGEKGAPSTVAGDKGQKGEIGVGDKGQKGEASTVAGDKGAKGEVGVGQKGQKGDDSAAGAQVTISDTAPGSANNGDLWWESDTFDLHVYYADGSSNQWVSITSNSALKGEKGEKGQKGEVGDKGQKGEIGEKGQKGEIGATGGTGGTGDKGTKGEPSTTAGSKGEKGQKGELNDKGQKGAAGSDLASVPSGGIILWSGAANAIPSGWYLCNGSNSTPNLSGKFVVGYSASDGDFDVNDTGGSKNATLVSHSHTVDNHTHGAGSYSAGSAGAHTHSFSAHFSQTSLDNDEGNATIYPNLSSSTTGSDGAHTHSVSGTSGGASPSTNSQGSSSTNANLPPYYALCYIMKA